MHLIGWVASERTGGGAPHLNHAVLNLFILSEIWDLGWDRHAADPCCCRHLLFSVR